MKLIFDITYLAHWHGSLTGIPRMINELALRYADVSDCRFVVWSNEGGKFYEADIKSVFKNRGVQIEYLSAKSDQQILPVNNFPIKVTRRLTNYRLPLLKQANVILVKNRHRKFKPLKAKSGDKLLIPMGEWASQKYIYTLKQLHESGVKLAQVVHDLLPLVTPQYSGHATEIMGNYCQQVLPICDLALAISQNTKKDLTTWLKQRSLSVPKTEIFRHGDYFTRTQPAKPKDLKFSKGGLKGNDYLLCVGTIEARKNHTLLYYVYKLAKEKNINLPTLLVVGRRGWKTDDIYEIVTSDPTTKDKILFLTDINDEELAWLYENCLFTVYPSFYEGWGIPIAESIAHGAPCISSNTSSMPEIAGDLIDYFSPASSDECLQAIVKLLKTDEQSKAKQKLKRYNPTSWDDTFKKVDGLIKGI